ncbi:MAG: PBSX family phage terminase large subunit [Clostridiales bacterium]|nr:PBSX family phage terminase large subunit [Clostridiales bacterium]
MRFDRFSPKQMTVLNWWVGGSGYENRDAIICDGAVRSGKTLCQSISFFTWAVCAFDGAAFALCGKTIQSLRRNVILPVMPVLNSLGFGVSETLSRNTLTVTLAGRKAKFYLFGGRDESSASLIQGMTLSGVMFDEAALMPRSFIEQAIARCSVEGSRFWFNCNPEHPKHWFYTEWIEKTQERNALYLHFTMRDNPSLSPGMIKRYEKMYSGPFYDRFVLGKWVGVEGMVYPMFSYSRHIVSLPENFDLYYISCDYGTVNPCSFGLWGKYCGVWYRIDEYYFDSKKEGFRRTDSEHLEGLKRLAGKRKIEAVIVDPSAASFIESIRRETPFRVIRAKNDVLDGIRRVSEALSNGKILFSRQCENTVREFGLYRWKENSGKEEVVKENDHAMDDIRYFVTGVIEPQRTESVFFALAAGRD